MPYFIKTGFWEKAAKGFKGWLNLDDVIASVGTATWGNITGDIANQTDVQARANTAVILSDAATIDIASMNNTLTSSAAARTFTISYTGDDSYIILTLNATTATYTFPATALTVSEGVASGNNILSLSGVSGDKYVIGIKKVGTAYYVASKNFGQ